MRNLDDYLEHLKYELRLLLGATKIVKTFEKEIGPMEFKNIINYFKDSAYVHARNLFEFFMCDPKSTNDIKINEFAGHNFSIVDYEEWVETYAEWKESLNRHVMHISPGRKNPTNSKDGVFLYDQLLHFVEDLENLWGAWVVATVDEDTKQQIKEILEISHKEAEDDLTHITEMIKGSNG